MSRAPHGHRGRVAAVLLVLSELAAHAATAPANDALEPFNPWSASFNLRLGLGYKDNILLGSVNEVARTFVATGMELFLLRLAGDGSQFYFFISGDDNRYLNRDPVEKEQTLIAVAQWKKELENRWHVAIAGQYLYQDQVIDVSTTESDLRTAPVKGHGLTLRPSLRRDFARQNWLELELPATLQILARPLDSYSEYGPKATMGLDYGHQSKLAFTYQFRERSYDNRRQTALDGSEIPSTLLEFERQDFELSLRHNWDPNRHWLTTTKLGLSRNTDNGSGYYDYVRYQFTQQIRYREQAWLAQAGVRFDHYEFLHQTTSPANAAARHDLGITVNFRCEKNLTKSLKLYAAFEYSLFDSNRPFYDYGVNTVSSGFDWQF